NDYPQAHTVALTLNSKYQSYRETSQEIKELISELAHVQVQSRKEANLGTGQGIDTVQRTSGKEGALGILRKIDYDKGNTPGNIELVNQIKDKFISKIKEDKANKLSELSKDNIDKIFNRALEYYKGPQHIQKPRKNRGAG
ncbi:hypothetical protein, partial [Wolbachia endosymbiont (group B) of Chorthippus brunneus]